MKKNLIFILFIILTLPTVVFLSGSVQKLLTRAAPVPGNLIIDTNSSLSKINNSWASFAQGGEEPPPMLTATTNLLKPLLPEFIRLDHIYDYYSVVEKNGDNFTYNFSKLDSTIDDIISTGAIPFLCLSYMPSAFTRSGSIIDPPADWNNWQDLVQKTVEHYSGKKEKNISGVYYEVWNEPELPQFGEWKMSGEKDYRLLYSNAVSGALKADNVNNFFIGGPAMGSYYKNTLLNFLTFTAQNKLRLDFISFHRYHINPDIFANDATGIRSNLSSFPQYADIPIILTEWGMESDNTPVNNSAVSAAFTVSAVSKFNDFINSAFVFEIKDGPPPNGGQWGLIAHEKSVFPLSLKPRYHAFLALKNLKGGKLQITGEGTFISALSAKSQNEISVVVSNFDLANKNTENLPVTFTGLEPSSYEINFSYVLDGTNGKYEIVTTDGVLKKSFIMPPNTVLLLKLTKKAGLAPLVKNENSDRDIYPPPSDLENSLIFHDPEFELTSTQTVSFDIKPEWDKNQNKQFIIMEAPYPSQNGTINRLQLIRQKELGADRLVFSVISSSDKIDVSTEIDSWQKNTWHNVALGWNPTGIFISADGEVIKKTAIPLKISSGKLLAFYPIEAAVDNFRIIIDDSRTLTKSFGLKEK